ncbi:hypothetical protein [Pararobbsia alpina]|uniref:Uncharacterized protein n=1 Tax=Pararobbsia alpina TaxID=621374 RepID=A0A6S7CKS0_9BURK|nr:hypothetical protein [Pararobbsia alpina]CAB3782198.1 hypothetical protein LMG28138_01461 [Pararobbsia alpina]
MRPPGWYHAFVAAKTLAILIVIGAALLAALWFASFFLYASLRMNPLHAGWWAWLDAARAARAGHDGMVPKGARRLIGSGVFGLLVAFGGPGLGWYALWERSGHRRLYGSARFASDAEIRAAGLL